MKFIYPLCIAIGLAVSAGRAGAVSISIPSQSLTAALELFAQQSGLEVVVYSEVAIGITAPAVSGELTADAAMERLLAGTELKYEYLDARTIAVLPTAEVARKSNSNRTTAGAERIAQVGAASAAQGRGQAADATRLHADKGNIAEITVTAQKRSERLQDVPVPVAILNGEALVDNGLLRVQDYYKMLPGLSLMLVGDAGQPTVVIRGIATSGYGNPPTGIVIDDVPYGTTLGGGLTVATAPDIEPGELARVEVLRGPQGTLYGASSMGGLLKFVTIDPSTDELTGRVQAGLTSIAHSEDLGHSLRGSINMPLSETLAARASVFSVDDPGYIDNIRTGKKDIDSRDSRGGRLAVLWRPTDDFSAKFGAIIQSSERHGLGEVNEALGTGLEQDSLNGTGVYERSTKAFSATVMGRFRGIDLVSATGYSDDSIDSRLDNPGLVPYLPLADIFGVGAIAQPLNQETKKLTQEVRAEIPLGSSVRWLAGAFYTDEDSRAKYTYHASDPVTGAPLSTFMEWRDTTTYEEYAAFTNITFDITQRIDVQVGGRISSNRQTFSSFKNGQLAPLFFGSDPSVITEKVSRETPVTYLLTPRFRISSDVMIYARLASGYRPGGPNTFCGLTDVPCEYDADKTQNYEIGIKGAALGGKFSFDASLYHIDWNDIQLSNTMTSPPFFGYLDNISHATSRGAELSTEVQPWLGATISGWVAWNDAKITEDPPPSSNFTGRRGDRLPFSSPFSGSIFLEQDFPLGSAFTGSVGGTASFVDERKSSFGFGAAQRETYAGYTQFDLRAGLEHDGWELNAFVTNLADKRGVLRTGLDAQQPAFFTYIQPRTIGINIARSW